MKYAYLLFILCSALLYSCKSKQDAAISFYYWKTNFALRPAESESLHYNNVNTLYLRYFDVDLPQGQIEPGPVSPVVFNDSIIRHQIIPVVYIKNRVFEKADSNSLALLAKNVFALIGQIDQSKAIQHSEIQFDCDWTERTKAAYFSFLQLFRSISKQKLSATIRLHQVKYLKRTGLPPVDRGVLMYYNMGEINAGDNNSVYDPAIASRYTASLGSYPLPLDVALPIFAWAQQLRSGKVVGLLNKLNAHHFADDSNFVRISSNRLQVKHACFKAGYYFIENDQVKLESVTEAELIDMAVDINKYLRKAPRNIIFYDLDSINLSRYDKGIYKKVLDGFN
jgi:hypothetical protein